MENRASKKRGMTTIQVVYALASTLGLGWAGWISSATISHTAQIASQTASLGDLPTIAQDSKEAKIQAGIAAGLVKELARSSGVTNVRIQSIEQKVRQEDADASTTTTSITNPNKESTVNVSTAF